MVAPRADGGSSVSSGVGAGSARGAGFARLDDDAPPDAFMLGDFLAEPPDLGAVAPEEAAAFDFMLGGVFALSLAGAFMLGGGFVAKSSSSDESAAASGLGAERFLTGGRAVGTAPISSSSDES